MEIDYTPQVGEQVEVFGHKGRFVIKDRKIGDNGHYLFRLESLHSGITVDNILYPMMTYPPEEKVRKVLPQVIEECGPWPDDFQGGRYDVKFHAMYDGTPRVMVYFYLKPDVIPSPEKARVWSNFYSRLENGFKFVDIDSGAYRLWDIDSGNRSTRLQFAAREERSAQRVAS
jgi:hypothetical protein